MGRPKKTTEQQNLVAAALYAGDPPRTACERAGYSKSTIKAFASRICKSDRVQARLQEVAKNIRPGELTDLGKGRIKQKLISGEKNDKTMLAWVRTAFELSGELGNHPNAELHLHSHRHEAIDPETAKMIAQAVREAWEENGWEPEAIDIEQVKNEDQP